MWRPLSLLALLSSGQIAAHAADWVALDKVGGDSHLLRQADRLSIRRTGPWVEFNQQWLGVKEGVQQKEAATNEVMAVNCLTGARSVKTYESTDPDTGKRVLVRYSFPEIEQGTSWVTRIDISKPKPGLDANLINFACACQAPRAGRPVDETTLLKIYDAFIKEQTREQGFHLHFMRFASREAANAALKKIAAGSSFTAVAAELKKRPPFEGGDLGVHPASAWPIAETRLFRTMKAGEYSKQPKKGIYGYDIHFMESRYEKPAAPFKDWRAAIETYAGREQACGRKIGVD